MPTQHRQRGTVEVSQTRVGHVETGERCTDRSETSTSSRGDVQRGGENNSTALSGLVVRGGDHQHAVPSTTKSVVERADVGTAPRVIVGENDVERVGGGFDVGETSSTDAVGGAVVGGGSAVVRQGGVVAVDDGAVARGAACRGRGGGGGSGEAAEPEADEVDEKES